MRLLLRLLLVLVLGLCSCSLIAQDEPTSPQQSPLGRVAQPPKPPAPTGNIHGTVFCGDTHKPARGAFVLVLAAPGAGGSGSGKHEGNARTSMDGSYTIANLAEGDYGVIAVLPGYLSPMDKLTPEDMAGDAAPDKLFGAETMVHVSGNQIASHDVTLIRGASVSGRVLYSDGSPATQVNIAVEDINAKPFQSKPGEPNINFPAFMRAMLTHQSDGTDDEGRFRISGLQPGTYRIAAVGPASIPEENAMDVFGSMFASGADLSALHFYSGDTLHKTAAKTYELRPGDDISGVDITIPLDALHQVRGVLSAVDGRPVNSGSLTLVDTSDDSLRFTAKPAADGVFVFPGVPSGTYQLGVKEARIMQRAPNVPPEAPDRYAPKNPISAFADANTTLIVKDSDLLDVSLPLTEIPLPKENNPPGAPPPPQ